MSVDAISRTSYPVMTRTLQIENPDKKQILRLSHKHYKNPTGKDITQDDYHVDNPENSDMARLLEHLKEQSTKDADSDMFKLALKHINNLESGAVKSMLPETKAEVKPENTLSVTDKKPNHDTDFSTLKFPADGLKISDNEMKQAVYAMRQDIKKEKPF